jgi:hypothetical protein
VSAEAFTEADRAAGPRRALDIAVFIQELIHFASEATICRRAHQGYRMLKAISYDASWRCTGLILVDTA